VLGVLAEQEGRRFGRRVAAVLPPLAALLTAAGAQPAMLGTTEAEDAAEGAATAAAGWREPYAALLLFERLTRQVGFATQVHLQSSINACWLACLFCEPSGCAAG
jgi:hypothetical protein